MVRQAEEDSIPRPLRQPEEHTKPSREEERIARRHTEKEPIRRHHTVTDTTYRQHVRQIEEHMRSKRRAAQAPPRPPPPRTHPLTPTTTTLSSTISRQVYQGIPRVGARTRCLWSLYASISRVSSIARSRYLSRVSMRAPPRTVCIACVCEGERWCVCGGE